jgi:hypothetical protein
MDWSTVKRASGMAAGAALAPWIAAGSFVRQARFFHPRGVALWARVTPVPRDDAWRELGESVAGSALVRLSGAWWKNRQWLDVLGCAVRFTHTTLPSIEPAPLDQDLLLATVRVPGTTLLAPLTTHVEDYLRNAYFGVSPFTFGELGRIKLRLVPSRPSPEAETRAEALDEALELGFTKLWLEARPARIGSKYERVAEIELIERALIDQEKLSFDPYRTGRGLEPAGFVHALRIPVYAASRRGRASAA